MKKKKTTLKKAQRNIIQSKKQSEVEGTKSVNFSDIVNLKKILKSNQNSLWKFLQKKET